MDERELVAKILQGDEKAKEQFFVSHRERLYRDCVYLLGYHDPEAEDVVQETFITAFEKLPQFEFRSSLATWLTQICIFKCHNRYRQRAKSVSQEQSELDLLLRSAAMERDEAGERETEKARQLAIVEKCLAEMSPECQDALRLRELRGLSYVEVGQALKIPLGTVMSRLSRCKKALKVLVGKFLKEG
ncbi:MAG TPA: RNA polymerase sigma factor [bacterium]|nr:RNA polymerase sigma factor [bacterium]